MEGRERKADGMAGREMMMKGRDEDRWEDTGGRGKRDEDGRKQDDAGGLMGKEMKMEERMTGRGKGVEEGWMDGRKTKMEG